MNEITEFLLARIAEDEAIARAAIAADAPDPWENPTTTGNHWPENIAFWDQATPYRVLAECAAKRMMIDFAEQAGMTGRTLESDGYGWEDTESGILKTLAAIYSDHPDYRQEWALQP